MRFERVVWAYFQEHVLSASDNPTENWGLLQIRKIESHKDYNSCFLRHRGLLWQVRLKYCRDYSHKCQMSLIAFLPKNNPCNDMEIIQRYRLSFVDQAGLDIWTSGFYTNKFIARSQEGKLMRIMVPSQRMSEMKAILKEGQSCFLRLSFFDKHQRLQDAERELWGAESDAERESWVAESDEECESLVAESDAECESWVADSDTEREFWEFWVAKSDPECSTVHSKNDSECSTVQMKNEWAELSQQFKSLLNDKQNFDVSLDVSGRTFGAHKAVLMARSPVFDRMFQSNMVEQRTGQVEIPDCDPGAFEVYLQFLYSGIFDGITVDNVSSLYYIATKYDSKSLAKECLECMKRSLSVERFSSFVSSVLLGSDLDSSFLDACAQYLANHFKQIGESAEWKAFLQDNPLQANELLIKAFEVMASSKK